MWKTLDRFTTSLRPDAVAWYPESTDDPQRSSFFTCALYELKEDDPVPERKGGIVALKATDLVKAESGDDSPEAKMQVVSEVTDIPGIYDMEWMKTEGDDAMLCTADAEGQIIFYDFPFELASSDITASIKRHSTSKPTKLHEGMALYVNICPAKRRLAVSSSKGAIHVYTIVDSSENLLVEEAEFQAHEFEAWVVHHDVCRSDVIYTGGDDCCLKAFDLRCDVGRQMFCCRRATAGVTSIATHLDRENELLVGSYDENLYIFDKRTMRQELDTLHLGGGVWRLQWHPSHPDLLAVAAMHAGFAVVKRHNSSSSEGSNNGSFSVESCYTSHDSLAYGIDWKKSFDGKNSSPVREEHLLASVSFYDRSLHLSAFADVS